MGKAGRDLLACRAPSTEPVSIKMATGAEHARYPTGGIGLGVPGPASGDILRLPSLKASTDCQRSQHSEGKVPVTEVKCGFLV